MDWDDDTMVGIEEIYMITGLSCVGDIGDLQERDPALPTPYWFADGSGRIFFDREQFTRWLNDRMDVELEELVNRS